MAENALDVGVTADSREFKPLFAVARRVKAHFSGPTNSYERIGLGWKYAIEK